LIFHLIYCKLRCKLHGGDGMPTGTLEGFALSMQGLPADHTYVESSHGHVWKCHGRYAGGTSICKGTGNTAQADCLSQPNSDAGIKYLGTGVCHQIANRILHPAAVFVSGARGYRASVFIYGTYGKDLATGRFYSPLLFPWPELQRCLTSHVHP